MHRLLCYMMALASASLLSMSGTDPENFSHEMMRLSQAVAFDREEATYEEDCAIDISEADRGVITVNCTSEEALQLLVKYEDKETCYAVPGDGTAFSVPLSNGNGHYKVSMLEHTKGIRYRYLQTVELDACMPDEALPFLYANAYVPWDRDTVCVAKARELMEESNDRMDFIGKVKGWIRGRLSYDKQDMDEFLSEHDWDLDRTLAERKGICIDYASMTCAMLRSQGVPAKLVFGYVYPDGGMERSYHAWVEVFVDGQWLLVDTCNTDESSAKSCYSPEQYF